MQGQDHRPAGRQHRSTAGEDLMRCRHAIPIQVRGSTEDLQANSTETLLGKGRDQERTARPALHRSSFSSGEPDARNRPQREVADVCTMGSPVWSAAGGPRQHDAAVWGCSTGGELGPMIEPTDCMISQLGKRDGCHTARAFTTNGSQPLLSGQHWRGGGLADVSLTQQRAATAAGQENGSGLQAGHAGCQ